MAIKRKDELEIPASRNNYVNEYDAERTALEDAAKSRVASAQNTQTNYKVPSIQGVNTEKFSYQNAPSYTSKYQDQIDDLMSSILNREQFSYDPESDPTYQQYKESYTRNGQRAMQDTIGQVSARTGGLASSYASAAGQQTYDGYMSALADKIPELRQLAYSMYQDDLNNQRANLDMLMNMENADYGRYQDRLGQYNTDRSFNYGTFSDDRNLNYGIYTDDRNYNYQVGRDEIADKRYEDETAYNRNIYQQENDYQKKWNIAEAMAQYGDFSGYKALGLSDDQIKNMKADYNLKLAAQLASSRKSGSSGGSSGGSRGYGGSSYGVEDSEGLYASAWASDNPKNYISSHYKDFGFSKSTNLYQGYEKWKESEAYNGQKLYSKDGSFDTLVNYTKKCIEKAGRSPEYMQDALKKQGYSDAVIDQVFSILGL
nr:MAG TPA: hypothetical protein [Caudoviricetes sp.]